jgi:hypothetical protein
LPPAGNWSVLASRVEGILRGYELEVGFRVKSRTAGKSGRRQALRIKR